MIAHRTYPSSRTKRKTDTQGRGDWKNIHLFKWCSMWKSYFGWNILDFEILASWNLLDDCDWEFFYWSLWYDRPILPISDIIWCESGVIILFFNLLAILKIIFKKSHFQPPVWLNLGGGTTSMDQSESETWESFEKLGVWQSTDSCFSIHSHADYLVESSCKESARVLYSSDKI